MKNCFVWNFVWACASRLPVLQFLSNKLHSFWDPTDYHVSDMWNCTFVYFHRIVTQIVWWWPHTVAGTCHSEAEMKIEGIWSAGRSIYCIFDSFPSAKSEFLQPYRCTLIIHGTSPPTKLWALSLHCKGHDHTCVQYVTFSYKGLLFVIILVFSHHLKRERAPKGPRWGVDKSWRAGYEKSRLCSFTHE
jgi:hypothetical protein